MEEDGGEEEGGRGGGTAVPLTGWNTGRSTLGKYSPACNAQVLQPRIYPARRGISNRKREDTGRVHGGRGKRTKGKRYRALPSEEGATCNDSI